MQSNEYLIDENLNKFKEIFNKINPYGYGLDDGIFECLKKELKQYPKLIEKFVNNNIEVCTLITCNYRWEKAWDYKEGDPKNKEIIAYKDDNLIDKINQLKQSITDEKCYGRSISSMSQETKLIVRDDEKKTQEYRGLYEAISKINREKINSKPCKFKKCSDTWDYFKENVWSIEDGLFIIPPVFIVVLVTQMIVSLIALIIDLVSLPKDLYDDKQRNNKANNAIKKYIEGLNNSFEKEKTDKNLEHYINSKSVKYMNNLNNKNTNLSGVIPVKMINSQKGSFASV